ncbi:alpha/beta fold hydrolase [Mycolicibacterium neoaurum]|uniref:alpha/beta fold hydrolase n=1 Tax=Mycolicibacterium neoaurum TaxID=1795 RepID=UPI001BCB72D1|nr:alpha/beta fold hydrolase [Mycolicibacterium neoaurum]QVI27267.1 alpha/beta fold hydrolase [Mycolicibacterium neoaurum]
MTVPTIATVDFGGESRSPLLIVGPSLGTSVEALWTASAHRLTSAYHVIGFDLPGHGGSPAPHSAFSIADIATAVHGIAIGHGVTRYHYAGVSAGGAIGLELLLQHGDSLEAVALICTAAKIRTSDAWLERADSVRNNGTSVMLGPAATTWFADGFIERDPATSTALLDSLRATDREGYARVCEALAQFDARDRLSGITGTVTAIAGAQDIATPPQALMVLAERIPGARYVELAETAHLAPAEQPGLIAGELLAWTQRSPQ